MPRYSRSQDISWPTAKSQELEARTKPELLLIRPATFSDVAAIMVLEQHASTAAHWTQVEYERIFTLGQTPRVALVAEDARKIVGFLIARALGLDWEIENIAVDEAVRRRGFGATLVRDFLRLARTRGAACVFLEVRESNQAARQLYQKLGFVPCGRRKSYYNNPLEDAVVYRFHLSESG